MKAVHKNEQRLERHCTMSQGGLRQGEGGGGFPKTTAQKVQGGDKSMKRKHGGAHHAATFLA